MPKKIPQKIDSNKRPTPEIPKGHKRASNFASYYVNSVNFAFTPFDIQMVCGRIEATMEEGNEDTDEIVTIFMNPKHAKIILKAFADSLKGYEEANGEILIPNFEALTTQEEQEQMPATSTRRKKN